MPELIAVCNDRADARFRKGAHAGCAGTVANWTQPAGQLRELGRICTSGWPRAMVSATSQERMSRGAQTAVWIVMLTFALIACGDEPDATATADATGGVRDAGRDARASAPSGDDDDFKGCPAGYPNVAPGLQAAGALLAVDVTAAMPEEPERYLNGWTVELSSLNGEPAPDAEIIRGETFMPVHGHDGRVQPRMTALDEPAHFQVDALNFTMRGPWEVRLWLRSGTGEDDYVVFDVCVAK
jgi:hypothetical protein